MKDYRFAKSLAERDEECSFTFIDQPAMDYLREFLKTREPLDYETLSPNNEAPGLMESKPGDDLDTTCVDSDSILKVYSASPCEAVAAAAEQRRASLAFAINAGFPGPSGLVRDPVS
ncbi:hypothetical protein C0992_011401 [Termitomyces sp. T32_za158]|nr:hypothetical protein C0992_011401 [Termitomyces sp. T32_za158]